MEMGNRGRPQGSNFNVPLWRALSKEGEKEGEGRG